MHVLLVGRSFSGSLTTEAIEGCIWNTKTGSFSDPETNRSMCPRVIGPRRPPKNGKQLEKYREQ